MPLRPEDRLLQALLAAEHAAVHGYGVLGARLEGAARQAAQEAATAHRARRDALTDLLRGRGQDARPALPGYDVAVAGVPDALALAVRLEEGLGVRWRDLVGGTDDPALRVLGTDGLVETAVRATRWREALGQRPATVALPGVAPD